MYLFGGVPSILIIHKKITQIYASHIIITIQVVTGHRVRIQQTVTSCNIIHQRLQACNKSCVCVYFFHPFVLHHARQLIIICFAFIFLFHFVFFSREFLVVFIVAQLPIKEGDGLDDRIERKRVRKGFSLRERKACKRSEPPMCSTQKVSLKRVLTRMSIDTDFHKTS